MAGMQVSDSKSESLVQSWRSVECPLLFVTVCSVKVGHLNVKMSSSFVSVRAAGICAFIFVIGSRFL